MESKKILNLTERIELEGPIQMCKRKIYHIKNLVTEIVEYINNDNGKLRCVYDSDDGKEVIMIIEPYTGEEIYKIGPLNKEELYDITIDQNCVEFGYKKESFLIFFQKK